MNLEKIKQVFYNVKIPNEFGGNIEEEEYGWVFDWLETNIIPYLDEEYDIAHGVSKIVLIPAEGDYVIKIPFNGTYDCIYDENGDVEDEEWREYYNAPEDCGWDYCAVEVEVYNKAKQHNVDCFFARTEFLCSTKNYHPIYIQEKVKTRYSFAHDVIKPSEKSLNDYKEKYSKNYGSRGVLGDANWFSLCLDRYGAELIKNFVEFLDEVPFINRDMHGENYGFRLNKAPCIIDFSDWCEND